MKYAIDRIEENIAVCESIETKEKIQLSTSILPSEIHEGAIIIKPGEKYIIDKDEEQRRRKRIEEKLARLKGLAKEKDKYE